MLLLSCKVCTVGVCLALPGRQYSDAILHRNALHPGQQRPPVTNGVDAVAISLVAYPTVWEGSGNLPNV